MTEFNFVHHTSTMHNLHVASDCIVGLAIELTLKVHIPINETLGKNRKKVKINTYLLISNGFQDINLN